MPHASPLRSFTRVQSNSLATRHILICLLLPLLVLAVFWPATHNEFVNYDDPTYVLENTHVHHALNAESIRWAFTTGYAANWHPLTWISHMVDCRLFGLGPRGHHFTSILLHALNTLLAYLALRALTGSTWRSVCVALLFGLHPLRVESVAWVSERKDVLSTFFGMATLWAYAGWAKASSPRKPGAWGYYILALLCLALGLMSKPMLVTLPCVLLLLDYWPLQRFGSMDRSAVGRLIVEKVPFFLLAAAACVITFIVQRQAGAVKSEEMFPFSVRGMNAVVAYGQYLGKFLRPTNLAVFYPHPGAHLSLAVFGISLGVLVLMTLFAVGQRKVRPWLLVGWLWYLGTLVPTIGLVQVGTQAMADRYTYVPLLGVAIALVWTAHELTVRWRIPMPLVVAGAAAGLLACATITRAQIGYWKTSETLFRHALAVTQGNAVAHINLAIALSATGRNPEALEELEAALQIAPESSSAHLNLAIVLDSMGHPEEATSHLLIVTHLEPGLAEGHFCLGSVLTRQRRIPEAIEAYRRALRLNPNHAEAHLKLGGIYYDLDRYPEALREFREVLRLRPDSADAQNSVGSVLFAQGLLEDAVPYYRAALRLQPDHADARRNFQALQAALAARSRR